MMGFIPTIDHVYGIACPPSRAAGIISAAGSAVLLFLTIMPGGCRTTMQTHHAQPNKQVPRAGNAEFPPRPLHQAEASEPPSSPADDYLSTEVGELMREDQERSGKNLTSRAKRPPPRRPGDTPLRPAHRPGMRPGGR